MFLHPKLRLLLPDPTGTLDVPRVASRPGASAQWQEHNVGLMVTAITISSAPRGSNECFSSVVFRWGDGSGTGNVGWFDGAELRTLVTRNTRIFEVTSFGTISVTWSGIWCAKSSKTEKEVRERGAIHSTAGGIGCNNMLVVLCIWCPMYILILNT